MQSDKQENQQYIQISPLKKLKSTFKNLDTSQSGFIDKKVLTSAIMYTGDNYDKQIIKSQIQKCQQKISFQKFLQIFQLAEIEMNQLLANQSLFKMYDIQNKGYIDANNLRRVSQIAGVQLTQQQIKEMLQFNANAGQVQFDQFVGIMNDQNVWF